MAGISNGTAISATNTAERIVAVWLAPSSQQATSRVAVIAAQ